MKKTSQNIDDWGDYMTAKKSKLLEQYTNEADNILQTSNIFENVSIFVNGYTNPPADELRRIVMSHGGVYHHYFDNGKTTYMIATVLPAAKINAFTHSKMKIIKPQWITDCVNAKKLLDHKPYLLLSNTNNNFFANNRSTGSENVDASCLTSHPDPEVNKSSDSNKTTDNSTVTMSISKNETLVSKSVRGPTKTARDENFIEEFYSNSRLHHLSTMSIKLKTFISDLRSKSENSFSGRIRLKDWKSAHENELQNRNFDKTAEKYIMHIDMDCFFVSVGIRNRPHLAGLPVAVAHSRRTTKSPEKYSAMSDKDNFVESSSNKDFRLENFEVFDSMSEIASCSYKAREFGIKNGMLVGQALKLCPQLTIIPYEFDAYEEVTYIFYKHMTSYTLDIEAVSCDEMFVDCTEVLKYANIDASSFATILRNEIKEITGCTCSVGFGPNRLISRLATRIAKPNGQLCIGNEKIDEFMKNIPVSYIPGVGGSISHKLSAMGVKTCEDMQKLAVSKLQDEFGKKMGLTLQKRCFGEDDRPLNFNHQRKSLSADVNYGIRFQTKNDAETFLQKLSSEVENRLNDEKLKGSSITLKFMVKSKNAPQESAKFLGHGICDTITKTISLNEPTSDSNIIFKIAVKIMNDFKISPDCIRGIGIQVSRLEKGKNCRSFALLDKFIVKKQISKQENYPLDCDSNICVEKNETSTENLPVNLKSSEQNEVKLEHLLSSDISLDLKRNPTTESIPFGPYIVAGKFNDLAPVSEIMRAVELWIAKEENPQLSDVHMFFSFVKIIAIKNDFESLNFIVEKLNRIFDSNSNEKWKMIQHVFMELVQYICQNN